MRKQILTLVLLMLPLLLTAQKTVLSDWQMESTLRVSRPDAEVSAPGFPAEGWHPVTVPSTVLSALVKEGVYPDPRVGMDNFSIPDVSDAFNERLGIPGENLWKDPWWYRTEFTLAETLRSKEIIWLHLDGINYRADIWVNGRQVASHDEVVGMFRRFRFNITKYLRPGRNVLAVKVWQTDHPGMPSPGTQFILFGPNRGNAGDIFRDETLKMSGGWDCAPVVRDRNMGLWQQVWLSGSDAVTVEDPYVTTSLQGRLTHVSFSAVLQNHSARSVRGTFSVRMTHLDSLDMGSWTKHIPADFTPVLRSTEVVLKPGERRQVAFYPVELADAPLWYPNGYGEQHLHHIDMQFTRKGKVSDRQEFDVGLREIRTELLDKDGEKGLVLRVNGKRIFCKGGWLQPDILLDNSRQNIYDQTRLLAHAHVNLVGSEDMPAPQEDWLDSWDRYGLLDWHVFYQCYRMYPGRANAHNPDDHALAVACARDELYRYRNHACIAAWCGVNEVMVDEDIYAPTRDACREIDPSRPFIPTTSISWNVDSLTPWIAGDLPTGTTDDGAPDYNWAPSDYYFDKVDEVHLQMFRNELGMPAMPVYSSLERFIPTLDKPFDIRDRLFPLDSVWAEHGAWDANNFCYRAYDNAIRTFYSDPVSARDYVRKGQMVSAEGYRAMYEAANHRMWDVTTGVMLWKLNACWPDVCWQLYDWYLEPNAAYWFARKAMEPVHIQYHANSHQVSVVNATGEPLQGVTARVRAFGNDLREHWSWSGPAEVPGESCRELVRVPYLPGITAVRLLRLTLEDAEGNLLSDNLYWHYTQHQNYAWLTTLPRVDILEGYALRTEGQEAVLTVTLHNGSQGLSFFNHLELRCNGEYISPVFWSDNFVTLFPGETRVLEARFSREGLQGKIDVCID